VGSPAELRGGGQPSKVTTVLGDVSSLAGHSRPGNREISSRGATLAWRLPVAGAVLGLLAAGLAELTRAGYVYDAGIFHDATAALLRGDDPYRWIATHRPQPLYYPLPALLILAPLGWLPQAVFHVVWSAIGGALLGLAASRRPGLAPVLLSAAFMSAAVEGQWSPVLTAGVVLPGLAALWIAKPSLALPLGVGWPFAIREHRPAIIGSILLLALSLAILPSWPAAWLEAVSGSTHHAPVMRPGGFLLLLAWLRWRQPEARLLGTLALIPHTVGLYEVVPLFLCCRSKWEGYALAGLTYLAAFLAPHRPGMSLTVGAEGWPVMLLLVYLPALALTLRPAWRPSTGSG
jgi:hypothetical protein